MPSHLLSDSQPDARQPTHSLPLQPLSTSSVKRRSRRWQASALAALCAVVLAGCSGQDKPAASASNAAAAPTVGVVVLAAENQTLSTELAGRTTAFQNADIRPQVNGIIQKRLFTEGAAVKAGQALYQVDASTYQASQASAQAALSKAQAAARTAQVNNQRNAQLVEIDAISRQVYDESQAAVQQTQADVAVAQAALENARINMRYTRILAPISGVVGLSSVTAGALVTANQAAALTTIQQLDPIQVDITQSSAELLALRKQWQEGNFTRVNASNAKVKLLLEDGSTYEHEGSLQFTGTAVNPTTGAVTLRATFPNPQQLLMPGMYVRAQLATSEASDALLVPQQAVVRDPSGKPSVQVVGSDNKIVKRPVQLGQAVGGRWLVRDGLAAGDKVMVDGFQKARPGQTVTPAVVDLRNAQTPRTTEAPPSAAAPAASAASAPRS